MLVEQLLRQQSEFANELNAKTYPRYLPELPIVFRLAPGESESRICMCQVLLSLKQSEIVQCIVLNFRRYVRQSRNDDLLAILMTPYFNSVVQSRCVAVPVILVRVQDRTLTAHLHKRCLVTPQLRHHTRCTLRCILPYT